MEEKNFLVIQGWMRTKLGLKGSELLAYALIYGFSQDGESLFCGSAKYVADWIGIDRRNALEVLRRLTEKGLIIKQEKTVNGVKLADYRINKNIIHGDETSQGGSDETSHHKDNKDNINKKDDTKVSSKKENDDTVEIENEIVKYTFNERVRASLREFVEYRRQKKEKMSLRAFLMMLNKLDGYTDDEKIDALETSMISNWTGVFPKHNYKNNEPAQRKDYSDIKKEDLEKEWDWEV